MAYDVTVLVVGGGPVGLSLALELSWRGIDAMLIEQSDGVPRHPKVGHISVRTMEHVRRWGILKQVRNCGFPEDYVLRMVYCTSMNGFYLCSHEYPSMRQAPTPPETPEKKQRCPQLWFDPILARAIRGYPHCTLKYHTELVGFAQDADGVTAKASGPGGIREIRARYLAACDGANSRIRDELNIAMTGDANLSRSIAIYFRAPKLLAATNQGEAERYTFVGPEGTWGNLTVVDGDKLWRLTVFGSQAKIDLDQFDAALWIHRCLENNKINFEVLSVLPWRRTELVAERFSEGQIFLVGDAAHTMSPTGGFGMNTGIGDAVDLGWKLQAVLSGWGGKDLLASYDCERRPIAVRNAGFSATNFRNLVSGTGRSAILEDCERGAAVRSRVGTETQSATITEYETLGVLLGYRYEDSPICIPDGTPAPPDRPDEYVPDSRPGARAPHVWLGPDQSILDLFGRGYVLLRFRTADTDRLEAAFQARRTPFESVDIADKEAALLYKRALVLVRPDGHVAWRGDRLPDDCVELVDWVRGAA